MPGSLSAMGLPRGVIPAIAEAATKDHSSATNPRAASAATDGCMRRDTSAHISAYPPSDSSPPTPATMFQAWPSEMKISARTIAARM